MEEKAARAACLILKHIQQVPQRDPTAHNMLSLYCKVGRHRSYALLIALLMWSSHIHEPQFWDAIVSPIRNEHLQKDGPCELLTLADLKGKQRSKGHVAFRGCLNDYADVLNCEFSFACLASGRVATVVIALFLLPWPDGFCEP